MFYIVYSSHVGLESPKEWTAVIVGIRKNIFFILGNEKVLEIIL